MLKILNVISDSNIGGAGRVLLTFLRGFDRERFNVEVALPRGSELRAALDGLGIAFHEVDGLAEKSLSFKGIGNLAKLIRKTRPAIVHTHASMSARIAAKFARGVKVVYTRHSVFPNRRFLVRFPGRQVFGTLNNFTADKVIAVSPAAKDNMTETGTQPQKVVVIYNGVEPLEPLSEQETTAAREHWGLTADDFVCSIVARLEPEKGHSYVLEAAAMLKEYQPQVKILIVGTGSQSEILQSYAQSEGLSNVIFTGFCNNIREIFAITDVSLNASYGTEATSLSLLEGMSLGVPAVVSDFGGNPFVVSDGMNGRVFPKNNSSALYSCIIELYENPEIYNDMCIKAYEKFNGRFTAKVMAENIEEVYRKLKNGRGNN
jgi:glycosyltransferase involved in cell wall biosynthesis